MNIVQKHNGTVECMKTDGTTCKEKDNAWDNIAV